MSDKVTAFLTTLEAANDDRSEIVHRLRDLITTAFPSAVETFAYGGLLYQDGSFLFAGLFARTTYVTVELGGGASITDAYGHLEGKGGVQGRKHIKVATVAEIETKHLAEYLMLAWETQGH